MRIRTRLLLFLLPTLIGGIALVSALLAVNWHREMALMGADMRVNLYHEGLKNWETGKEASSDSHSKANSRALEPAAAREDEKSEGRSTSPETNSSVTSGVITASITWIVLSAGSTIVIMIATLFMIANRISRPIQRLNQSALAIAAGQYGESIDVEGPKEIAELANTLNTMSQCLYENINRLKENSLYRERMYGEYECALLLQHLMLQKNIEACRSDAISVKAISFFSETPRGFLLDFPKPETTDQFCIRTAEAKEEGFEGMYELLTELKQTKKASQDSTVPSGILLLDKNHSSLEIKGDPNHPVLVWSYQTNTFLPPGTGPHPIASGDLCFIGNHGLVNLFRPPGALPALLSKVLNVFAQDGLESFVAMLQKELGFILKRKHLEEDIHLLVIQILTL
ncbi:MAG: hypothetical protein RL235_143 [Chlamydiota bacterium]|jgi:HAMP domain-containing protein